MKFMSMRQSSLKVLLFALPLLVDRVLTLLVVRGEKCSACLRA